MKRRWTFDRGPDGFAYADDAFRDDAFRFTDEPDYATGGRTRRGGYDGDGALTVKLGGVDAADVSGMSGGWWTRFTLDAAQPVKLTFRYKIDQGSDCDSNQYSEVRVALDGRAFGKGGNDHIARIYGDGDGGADRSTGWKTVTIDLGELTAGRHTLKFGGFSNRKTTASESTRITFDDVTVETVAPTLAAFEARVLELTNGYRAEHGRAPLLNDAKLNAAAEDWSRTMAQEDFFRHSTTAQVEEFGYAWRNWGENIAAGYQTPESVVEGWIDSPGHRANLLSDQFAEIGLGYYYLADDTGGLNYRHYWTQAFGTELV